MTRKAANLQLAIRNSARICEWALLCAGTLSLIVMLAGCGSSISDATTANAATASRIDNAARTYGANATATDSTGLTGTASSSVTGSAVSTTTTPAAGVFTKLDVGNGAPNSGVTAESLSVMNGNSTNYISNNPIAQGKGFIYPYFYTSCWQGTPYRSSTGYQYACNRMDVNTKPNVDVTAGYGLGVFMNSQSNNSGGAATSNNTAQTAFLANCAASGSAACMASNLIATSSYLGNLPQTVAGQEINLVTPRDGCFWGCTRGPYALGQNINLIGNHNGSVGLEIQASTMGHGWLLGAEIASAVNVGLMIDGGATIPKTGVEVQAATEYGIYVGCDSHYAASFSLPCDAAHNPMVGINLGSQGGTTAPGKSNSMRYEYTDSRLALHNWQEYADSLGTFHIQLDGADVMALTGLRIGSASRNPGLMYAGNLAANGSITAGGASAPAITNTGDVMLTRGILTTTAASSDTVSAPGITASSHCGFAATNLTAARLSGVYIVAGAGRVTLYHPATAAGTFNIFCSVN